MSTTSWILLALTIGVALVDWYASHTENRSLEYLAKPGVMVLLLGVALTLPAGSAARLPFLLAVLFSLAGDVFLMLPDRKKWFVFGLASFLVGHLCYIPGLWSRGVGLPAFVVGLVVVLAGAGTVGLRVLGALKQSEPKLLVPVQAYMAVLGLMAASAVGTALPVVAIGGILFFCSDSILAWNEFVHEVPYGKLLIHVTYHLGQIGLVMALL